MLRHVKALAHLQAVCAYIHLLVYVFILASDANAALAEGSALQWSSTASTWVLHSALQLQYSTELEQSRAMLQQPLLWGGTACVHRPCPRRALSVQRHRHCLPTTVRRHTQLTNQKGKQRRCTCSLALPSGLSLPRLPQPSLGRFPIAHFCPNCLTKPRLRASAVAWDLASVGNKLATSQSSTQLLSRHLFCRPAEAELGSLAAGVAVQAARSGAFPVLLGASFQLFLLCGFVGWLLHSGRIPDDTAPVLSKASARLCAWLSSGSCTALLCNHRDPLLKAGCCQYESACISA